MEILEDGGVEAAEVEAMGLFSSSLCSFFVSRIGFAGNGG